MERAPAVPELLRRLYRGKAAALSPSVDRERSALGHQRVTTHRVARRRVGALEGEETRRVRSQHHHDWCSADDVVERALALEAVPIVCLAVVADGHAHHPRLV